jgi:hypothetical protein
MSEENQAATEPAAPVATPPATPAPAVDTEALQRSVEALERKNKELISELRAAKKQPTVPDGVDINELLEFKRRAEQAAVP